MIDKLEHHLQKNFDPHYNNHLEKKGKIIYSDPVLASFMTSLVFIKTQALNRHFLMLDNEPKYTINYSKPFVTHFMLLVHLNKPPITPFSMELSWCERYLDLVKGQTKI